MKNVIGPWCQVCCLILIYRPFSQFKDFACFVVYLQVQLLCSQAPQNYLRNADTRVGFVSLWLQLIVWFDDRCASRFWLLSVECRLNFHRFSPCAAPYFLVYLFVAVPSHVGLIPMQKWPAVKKHWRKWRQQICRTAAFSCLPTPSAKSQGSFEHQIHQEWKKRNAVTNLKHAEGFLMVLDESLLKVNVELIMCDSTNNLCNLPHLLHVWFCWWVMTFALLHQLFHCPNETPDFFMHSDFYHLTVVLWKLALSNRYKNGTPCVRLAKMSVIFVTPSFVCMGSYAWPVFYLMRIDTCTCRLVCDLCVYILHFIIPSGNFSVLGRKPSRCRHWFIC